MRFTWRAIAATVLYVALSPIVVPYVLIMDRIDRRRGSDDSR